MNGRRKRMRCGFTLIELVVSALLSSIMLAALLSIMWSAMRDTQELKRNDLDRASVDQLVDVLHRDFQNARGMTANANQISLHGFLGSGEFMPDLSPGAVQYQQRQIGDHSCLTRTVRSLRGTQTELIWRGFGSFRIDVLELESDSDEKDAETEIMPIETGGLPPIPASFRITLFSERGRVLHREVIHHHAI